MSHTTTLPRPHTQPSGRNLSLIDPAETVIEGTCPSARCLAVLPLSGNQMPEHDRAGSWLRPRRCPCSGWLARDPHPRKHFYVEGVHWL